MFFRAGDCSNGAGVIIYISGAIAVQRKPKYLNVQLGCRFFLGPLVGLLGSFDREVNNDADIVFRQEFFYQRGGYLSAAINTPLFHNAESFRDDVVFENAKPGPYSGTNHDYQSRDKYPSAPGLEYICEALTFILQSC